MNSDVAVLIVSYNARRALCRAIRSIPQDAHIVVVDNASEDDSVAHVQTHHPDVTLVVQQQNLGFSKAVNLAAQQTRAHYLLVLNPDAWLLPGATKRLKRSLDHHGKHNNVWIVGAKQHDDEGRWQLSVGPRPSWVAEGLRCLVQRTLDRPTSWAAKVVRRALCAHLNRATLVPWVAGSALFMRRSHFLRVGGFDPDYFLYFEDIDLCLRVRAAGGQVLYDPSIVIGHSRGLCAAKALNLARGAYRKSQARFAAQHMTWPSSWAYGAWAKSRGHRGL